MSASTTMATSALLPKKTLIARSLAIRRARETLRLATGMEDDAAASTGIPPCEPGIPRAMQLMLRFCDNGSLRGCHRVFTIRHIAPIAGGVMTGMSTNTSMPNSLRRLCREFLSLETRQHFVVEFILFAILFGVSAWPILSMVATLSTLVR